MKKRYEKPAVHRLTMVPEVAISVDLDEIDPLSFGWDNEVEV